MGNSKSKKKFVATSQQQQFPRPEDLFSHDELKSARLVALQGPFVDTATGNQLREFYKVYAPEKNDEEHINKIVHSGMELKMLNSKLREKYGVDLDDFVLERGGKPQT